VEGGGGIIKMSDNQIDRVRHVHHNTAKLCPEDVRKIRYLYREVGLTQLQISAQYLVRQDTIRDILTGSTWKHVD
jgi:hypothetical protein